MHYRRMTSTESLEYRSIRLESLMLFPESFSANYNEAKQKPKLFFEEYLEQENARNLVIGAYDSASLVGIIAFSETNEYGLTNTGTFIQMYVKRPYQGRGVGLGLTRFALQQAAAVPGIEKVVLEVKKDNGAATAVYAKAGFSPLDQEKSGDTGLLVMSCFVKLS